MNSKYVGLALMGVGASLLMVCRLAAWQSNGELLTGLTLVVTGYVVYLWVQKHGETY